MISKLFEKLWNSLRPATRNLDEQRDRPAEQFDYVINCTSHFTVPDQPDVPGEQTLHTLFLNFKSVP